MDEYVKDLLRTWELEELISRFEAEEVNEKAFNCLTEDIIRELIPKLGKRAIFNKAYEKYRDQLIFRVTNTKQSELETTNLNLENAHLVKPAVGIRQENHFKGNICPQESLPTLSIEALTEPTDSDRQTADALRNLLSDSSMSVTLLNKEFLTPVYRRFLSDEIITFLYNKFDGDLTAELLNRWARAVELVFPSEAAVFYFRQTTESSAWAGKLYASYQKLHQLRVVEPPL
ncbi:uncharacterized protein LOC129722301 [Wyeomyia smithii]|uniref:uncharacterized protein LOC129722301 n=1 Tax=Wyeomyia smithii TaxID=174621 RepID=UPI002467FA3E|nr:uncharacterized protein LOC129722301 [Wyeomyia smithii]